MLGVNPAKDVSWHIGVDFQLMIPTGTCRTCLSLLPGRQNSLRGEDGHYALSPEFPYARFLHQPAVTAENPNSTARVPQMTPLEA